MPAEARVAQAAHIRPLELLARAAEVPVAQPNEMAVQVRQIPAAAEEVPDGTPLWAEKLVAQAVPVSLLSEKPRIKEVPQ